MIERTEIKFFESLVTFLEVKKIVEIGVAYGDGTECLCKGASKVGGWVYGFDVWKRHGLKKQFKNFSTKEKVEERLKKAGCDNFTLTKIDSIEQKETLIKLIDSYCPDGIDFAFIDGDHSYLGLKNDFSIVYPRLKSTGVIAFHDTLMIDGCREFVLDLRTKYNDGTYDIVDFPFGCHSNRRIGISLLVKNSYPVIDDPIIEVCGSILSPEKIEEYEKAYLTQKISNRKNRLYDINSKDKMTTNVGTYNRKKYDE